MLEAEDLETPKLYMESIKREKIEDEKSNRQGIPHMESDLKVITETSEGDTIK